MGFGGGHLAVHPSFRAILLVACAVGQSTLQSDCCVLSRFAGFLSQLDVDKVVFFSLIRDTQQVAMPAPAVGGFWPISSRPVLLAGSAG